MPFLQSSGAISINDIRNMFGGPSSPSLANYFRGGGYIPSTKTITNIVREPPSGDYYSRITSNHSFYSPSGMATWFSNANNPNVGWQPPWMFFPGGMSFSQGGYTYYAGSLREVFSDYYGTTYYHGIYRTYGTSSTANINTGVPSSGSIGMNQFYGAEKP